MPENKEMEQSMTQPASLRTIDMTGELEMVLSQTINLSPENILHEPTCLICSSPNRDEVEKKFLENKDNPKQYEETIKTFKSKSNIPISRDIIDNHMRFHYDKGGKEIQKMEYIARLKRLNSVELTTLDRINIGFSAIEERLVGINSITPSGDISVAEVEKIKSAETAKLMLAFNQLLKLKASILGEMKNSGELITLPRQAFVDIFTSAIADAKNDGEKALLKKILSDLASLSSKTQ